jgi:tRNA nucleotidyltransferase (CCA-adding enzyme)
MKAYLVGGCVRDGEMNRLLGTAIQAKDRDWVVVGSTEEAMLRQGFKRVGAFPVFLHPKNKEEWALARTEKKKGRGYTGFDVDFNPNVTLEEDLSRRDLTINAMAQDPSTGLIIDPYNGKRDIQNKILRHTSPAFVDDPLRVLRVARFAARFPRFTIAPETLTEMKRMAKSGELNYLTPERVWQETQSALRENRPDIFFQALKECHALEVVWPELDALWHHSYSDLHPVNVLQHSATLSAKDTIRFAALCLQLGKTNNIEQVSASCTRFKVPNDYKQLAMKVGQFHLQCHSALNLTPDAVLIFLNQLDVWRKPQEFDDFLVACEADATALQQNNEQPYLQAELLRLAANKCAQVNARKFVEKGMKGKQIKEALNEERVGVIKDIKNRAMCAL